MAEAVTNPYMRRLTSRWRLLPRDDEDEDEVKTEANGVDTVMEDAEKEAYCNLLLFIKKVPTNYNWQPLLDFIQARETSPDTGNDLLRRALASVKVIGKDYGSPDGIHEGWLANNDRPPEAYLKKMKRELGLHDLVANQTASWLVRELDELVKLGRTAYDDPDELKDGILGIMTSKWRSELSEVYRDRREAMTQTMHWAERWAEVRYRFLNHAAKDDPQMFDQIENPNDAFYLRAGMAANAIVHNPAVEMDCDLVEFRWFIDANRDMFYQVYMLEPPVARWLRDLSTKRGGLSKNDRYVFEWIIDYINSYISWRIEVLEAVRKEVLADASFKPLKNAQDRLENKKLLYKPHEKMLRPCDDVYAAFIDAIQNLMEDTENDELGGKLSENRMRVVDNSVTRATGEVRVCTLNKLKGLRPGFKADKFPKPWQKGPERFPVPWRKKSMPPAATNVKKPSAKRTTEDDGSPALNTRGAKKRRGTPL